VEVEVVRLEEKIESCSQQDIQLHVTQVVWRRVDEKIESCSQQEIELHVTQVVWRRRW